MQDRDHLIRSGIIHDLLRPTLDWMLVQEYAAGSKFQDAQRRLKNSVLMWIENKTKANGTPAGCSLAVFPILDLLWEHGLSCGESVGDLTTYITEIAAFQYSDLPHSNPQERKMTTFFSKIQLIIKLYDEEVRLRNSQSIHDRCEFKSVVDEFVVQTGAIFQGEGLTRHSMVIRHRFPLKIALHNVIDNAQKHGKPGGAVIIGAQTRAGSNDLDFVDITVQNVVDNAQKHGKPGGAVIIGAQTRAGSNDLDFVDITVTNSRKTDSRPSTITTEAVSGTKIIQSACSLIGATWSFCITGDDAIAVIADIPSVRSKNQQQSEE